MIEVQDAAGVTHVSDYLDVDDAEFSDLGDSIASATPSISSSMLNYVYENGRRYHSLNAGTYAIPNDESEQNRLDMFYHGMRILLEGELYLVKLPAKLDRILDVGTGTGIWAIDMADQHPEATVIGVDLSPIQPSWITPNCIFEVDDVEQPWLWEEKFDFIHSANLAQGIRDWPLYTKRILENLTPGGVVQFHEAQVQFISDDNTIPKGGYIEQWQSNFYKAALLAGLQEVSDKLETCAKDAGFEKIRVVVKKFPIGSWAKDPKKKEIGKWGLAAIDQALKGYGTALFTRHLGMSPEEAETICDGAFNELCRRSVHTYVNQWFVEGRKPENAN